MIDKNNIIICSKNRAINDTPSNITVNLNTDLICNDDEFFTVKINQFNMIKSFYSVQTGLNDELRLYLYLDGVIDDAYVRKIPQGNYSVNTLIQTLKQVFIDDIITVDYDRRLNKFFFKRKQNAISDIYDKVSIVCINSGIILGIENNEELFIDFEGVLSTKFVNISGYEMMLIKLGGDISIDKSYMNLTNQFYTPSQVIAMINLQQYIPMDSIILNNSNENDNNIFVIKSKKISSFNIQIVNENNVEFPQMSDFILSLCFEKHTNKNLMLQGINAILVRLNDLMFYVTYLFSYFNIGNNEQ